MARTIPGPVEKKTRNLTKTPRLLTGVKQGAGMTRALVIGASGGIGAAVAGALDGAGAGVVRLSRREDGLDITDEAGIASAFQQLSGQFDLIFIATGGLQIGGHGPEKSLRQIDAASMAAHFALNAIGPALVLKHALPLLPRDRRAQVAVLSARVGSIGDNRLGGWYGYRAAKAALNQIVHTAAIELARTHRQAICVALHPGTVKTALTADFAGNRPTVSPVAAATRLLRVLDGLTPSDSGGFFDWAGKAIPW